MSVPILETPRLRLRGSVAEDFPSVRDIWADERVTRFIGGKPQAEEVTWTKFLRKIGHWELLGFGYWTVEHRDSGAVIGEVGFGEFKREFEPSIKGEPEMGWVIAPEFHGKGVAAEACKAALDWGDAHFKQARMSCIMEPANAPSVKLAEKLGFSTTLTTTYHGTEILVMHRDIIKA